MSNKQRLDDHQFALICNELRDLAKKYHNTQQLRAQLQGAIWPMWEEIKRLREEATFWEIVAARANESLGF